MSNDVLTEPGPPGQVRFNPWLFVPLLYFMQAMPVTIVQEVAAIFYKDLGVENGPILQWTSLISLPWSMQLLLGPLVDLNSTKRKWILGGQFLIAIGLGATAFALNMPFAFEITLVILAGTAITSALCNIATDGFYILAMSKEQQAEFVGVQTTSYRLGRLFCTGLLVLFVGLLTVRGVDKRLAWTIILAGAAAIYFLGYLANQVSVPRPVEDQPQDVQSPVETRLNIERTLVLVGIGLSGYFFLSSIVKLAAHGVWAFRDGTRMLDVPGAKPTGFQGWALPYQAKVVGFPSPLEGVQTEVAQLLVCGIALAVCIALARALIKGTVMAQALGSYIRQSGFPAILGFILFYRFGEAMVGKMSPLFLKDAIDKGGLAIANDQLGLIKGVAGVLGIVCGGLAGGLVVSKIGLRRAFWPLVIAMHTPNLLYVWASIPDLHPPIWSLYIVDFVDQFGYGFGFAGYMVYIMWVAQRGHFKTTHYAIGTGMGALCIAIAGIVSGIIQQNFGYHNFFISVIFLTIPGMLMLLFIPLDESHRQIPARAE
jgi:PAT family beta-lactamase induction signal transducer AmpG